MKALVSHLPYVKAIWRYWFIFHTKNGRIEDDIASLLKWPGVRGADMMNQEVSINFQPVKTRYFQDSQCQIVVWTMSENSSRIFDTSGFSIILGIFDTSGSSQLGYYYCRIWAWFYQDTDMWPLVPSTESTGHKWWHVSTFALQWSRSGGLDVTLITGTPLLRRIFQLHISSTPRKYLEKFSARVYL